MNQRCILYFFHIRISTHSAPIWERYKNFDQKATISRHVFYAIFDKMIENTA